MRTEPEIAKSRGEKLRQLRDAKGLGLKPAAELGNISMSTIKNIENGHTLDPKISAIPIISRVYDLSTEEVLELYGIRVGADTETEARLQEVEEAANGVLVAIWKAIQNGVIDERSVIADQALRLRDSLNPDWPNNPEWLPEELREI